MLYNRSLPGLTANLLTLNSSKTEFCHQGSWLSCGDRKRGVWERARTRVSSFTSLFDSFKHAFRHDGNTAFVRTFYFLLQCHRYTSPRCVRSSRRRTSQTRRPPALSCRDERHKNSNSKHEQEVECHTLHTPIYILVSYSPSAQGTLPRPNTRIPSPK